MNLREAKKQAALNIRAGITTMFVSDAGFGKTWTAFQIMRDWANWPENVNKRVGYSYSFMATKNPTSITGLPWYVEKEINGKIWSITQHAIPDWYMCIDVRTGEVLPASCFDIVFLMFDEFGQGPVDAKKSAAEVILNKGIPGYYLPAGSPCILMSNEGAVNGVTKDFPFLRARRRDLFISKSANVWVEDFAEKEYEHNGRKWKVSNFDKMWARQHEDLLFEEPPDQQQGDKGLILCNPRAFTLNGQYMQVMQEAYNWIIPPKDSIEYGPIFENIAAGIGMNAAQAYIGKLEIKQELPSLDTIYKHPDTTPIPKEGDLQMLAAYEFASEAEPDHLPSLVKWFTREGQPRFAKDMEITFFKSLMQRRHQFRQEPPVRDWMVKNGRYIAAIANLTN